MMKYSKVCAIQLWRMVYCVVCCYLLSWVGPSLVYPGVRNVVSDFGLMGLHFGLIGSSKGGVVAEKETELLKIKYGRFHPFVREWHMSPLTTPLSEQALQVMLSTGKLGVYPLLVSPN